MKREITRYPIIVHCHLPWNGVWQRPQQFHSRLSKRHPILFIEGPIPNDARTISDMWLKSVPEFPHIQILRMEVPGNRWGDGAFIDAERRRLLDEFVQSPGGKRYQNAVHWFYDPMAITAFAENLDERAFVYDCMDQLSQFKFAPPEIIEREKLLLQKADLVFAGGPKMHQSKSQFHDDCHCYGCGVDAAHFGKAMQEDALVPTDLKALSGPVLGFFGVVDERMDYELLDYLAATDPRWNVVIIGPTAKVDPAHFPKHPNLHFLGRREYAELPYYCKGFDVCLMPFAINEATEYINPTKALEYMATGRPIVSTPVQDVVAQFSEIVAITRTKEDFAAACRKAILQPDRHAVCRGLIKAQNSTWDAIVEEMEQHLERILAERRANEIPQLNPLRTSAYV